MPISSASVAPSVFSATMLQASPRRHSNLRVSRPNAVLSHTVDHFAFSCRQALQSAQAMPWSEMHVKGLQVMKRSVQYQLLQRTAVKVCILLQRSSSQQRTSVIGAHQDARSFWMTCTAHSSGRIELVTACLRAAGKV